MDQARRNREAIVLLMRKAEEQGYLIKALAFRLGMKPEELKELTKEAEAFAMAKYLEILKERGEI